jgi:hypothetical protein
MFLHENKIKNLLHLRAHSSEGHIISWVLKEDPIVAVTSDSLRPREKIILGTEGNAGRIVVTVLNKHLFNKWIFVQIKH